MYNPSRSDELLTEFRHERSVRRTAAVLEAKRNRIRDELRQLVQHIALLVPAGSRCASDSLSELLQDAAERLGDDAFAQLLLQVIRETQ